MTPEELLKSKNIKYNYSGGDLITRCLNPDHEDKNPSLRIDKLSGVYNCYSCGFKGTIYNYFGIYQNMLDIKIQRIKNKIEDLSKPKLYLPLNREPFTQNLRGISSSTFKDFGAFTSSNKEYEDRIVFPIYNVHDDIVCFVARYIHSNAKPKYVVLPSGSSKPIYPAFPIIKDGTIIVVEGLFDVLNLYDKGLKNTVCLFGVESGKTEEEIINNFSNYKLQGVNKIILMLDGDKAGSRGALKLENALKKSYIIERIDLPEDQDPGSFNKETVDSIKEYLYG